MPRLQFDNAINFDLQHFVSLCAPEIAIILNVPIDSLIFVKSNSDAINAKCDKACVMINIEMFDKGDLVQINAARYIADTLKEVFNTDCNIVFTHLEPTNFFQNGKQFRFNK